MYELAHDTIAKQIFEKASTEARTRRKVERYIRERHEAFQHRKAPLTKDDVDYIWPYLEVVNCSEEELAFVQSGKKRLARNRRTWQAIVLSTLAVFAALTVWALFQTAQATLRLEESKSMRIGLAAKYALYEGHPTLAFRLAEQTLDWKNDPDAMKIATEVLQEIQANPLVRDITHKGSITAMQFMQSGKTFFTASMDGEVRISNLSGDTLQSYLHASGVVWGKLVQNDQVLLTLTEKDSIGVYNIVNKENYRFYAGGKVNDVYYMPQINGFVVAVDQELRFWDFDQGKAPISTVPHPAKVTNVAMAKIGEELHFFSSDETGQAYRWNQSGEQEFIFENYADTTVTDIAIDSINSKVLFQTLRADFITTIDGDSIRDKTAKLFNVSGSFHSKFSLSNQLARIVSISHDSNLVFIWNVGNARRDIDLQHSPKGKVLFAGLSDHSKLVLIGDTANETVVTALKDNFEEQHEQLFRFNNRVENGVFSPNHLHFLSSVGGKEVLLWKLDQQYVNNKMNITLQQLRDYYNKEGRIRGFTDEELERFKLND